MRFILIILTLTFCQSSHAVNSISPTKIVSSVATIDSLVRMVAKNLASYNLIIKENDDPHHFHLTPSDAKNLSNAQIIFMVDDGYEFYLNNKISNLGNAKIIKFTDYDTIKLFKSRNSNLWIDDEHDDDHHSCSGHHDHGVYDIHIWLSIKNAIAMIDIIKNELSIIDPKNAESYSKNAIDAKNKLNILYDKTAKKLSKINDISYIVFHDAYQYFEKEFNIPASASILDKNTNDKNIKSLSELAKFIKSKNIKCVIYEEQFSRKKLGFLNNSTNIKRIILDPLWGYDDNGKIVKGERGYFSLIDNITKGLESCSKD